MNLVQIDIISDLVCPWCYIGRKRLTEAIAKLPDLETQIRWQPFELFPRIPVAGVDRHNYMADVFGSAQRRDAIFAQVAETGLGEGLDFSFDTIPVSPNTFSLHRLLWKAGLESAHVQDELAQALFAAFFTQNQDLSQLGALIELLRPFGWSADKTLQFLATDEGAIEVRVQQRHYRFSGITSVPTYLFNNQFALVGAQPSEQFGRAITQAAAQDSVPGDTLPSSPY